MKKLRSKLNRSCYFKDMTSSERCELLNEFDEELAVSLDGEAVYQKYSARVFSEYKRDIYKIFLFLLHMAIAVCSVMASLTFIDGASALYNFFTCANYGAYGVLVVSVIGGFIGKKIEIKEYKYHFIALLLHVVLTIAGTLTVLYILADALSSF